MAAPATTSSTVQPRPPTLSDREPHPLRQAASGTARASQYLLAELAYDDAVLEWLLAGDPAVRWQVMRDLLGESVEVWEGERRRVAETGWGPAMLERRGPTGWPKGR
jgi:hypothetical protein